MMPLCKICKLSKLSEQLGTMGGGEYLSGMEGVWDKDRWVDGMEEMVLIYYGW